MTELIIFLYYISNLKQFGNLQILKMYLQKHYFLDYIVLMIIVFYV